jgi:hypothetical protein
MRFCRQPTLTWEVGACYRNTGARKLFCQNRRLDEDEDEESEDEEAEPAGADGKALELKQLPPL